jgi:hypothetical protein
MVSLWDKLSIKIYLNKNISYVYFINDTFTSLVKINDNSFSVPVRFPESEIESIDKRHKHDIIYWNNFSISTKMILSLLDGDYKELMIKEGGWGSNEPEKNYCELLQEVDPSEIKLVIDIISNYRRNLRQRSLSKLSADGQKTVMALLVLLSATNDEIKYSIFRELGMRKMKIPFLVKLAKQLMETEPSQKYSFLYLLSVDRAYVENLPYYRDLKFNALIFKNHSREIQWRTFKKAINSSRLAVNQAFLPIAYFGLNDEKILIEILNQHYNNHKSRYNLNNIQSALVLLLKFAEVSESSSLLGFIICLMQLGKHNEIKSTKELDQSYIFNSGYYEKKLNYIYHRIKRLIKIWDDTGRSELGDKGLEFYLTNIPPEITIYDSRRTKYPLIRVEEWIDEDRFFSLYRDRMLLIITKNQFLSKVIPHLSHQFNFFFFTLLLNKFNISIFRDALAELTFNDRLYLYMSRYKYPQKLKLYAILKRGRSGIENPPWDVSPRSSYEVLKILNFFYRFKFEIPNNIFLKLMKAYYKYQLDEPLFIEQYLSSMTSRIDHYKIRDYLEIIIKEIEDNIEFNKINIELLRILLKWENNSNFSLSQIISDKVTALKILYQDEMDIEKIEAFHMISTGAISNVYQLNNGKIPSLIESNIQYSLRKPNWDQVAQHYLALGLHRPNRDEIMKSQLKDIPSTITKDSLGKIALVTQTINYCKNYGFKPQLEKLIIKNIYFRGWNIERGVSSSLYNLFGSISNRLKSYIAAYLILEKSDITNEALLYASNVENYQIRSNLIRTMDRFGSPDMWLILGESIFEDVMEYAISHLQRTRIPKIEKFELTKRMLISNSPMIRKLGIDFLSTSNFHTEDEPKSIISSYNDTWIAIIDYTTLIKHKLSKEEIKEVLKWLNSIIWQPRLKIEYRDSIYPLIIQLYNEEDTWIEQTFASFINSTIKTRIDEGIETISQLQERINP